MASMNKVFLMGNLTRDPELRQVGERNAVCNFGLAMNRSYTTSGGEEKEDTCFVDVEAWGRQGENCNRFLSKGRQVLVEGRLRQDRWEEKETGKARSRLRVTALNVQFLDGGGQGQGGGNEQSGFSEERSRQGGQEQSDARDGGSGQSGYNDTSSDDDDIPF